MKKMRNILLCAVLLAGCSSAPASSDVPQPDNKPADQGQISQYSDLKDAYKRAENYTAAVNNQYRLAFSDETQMAYEMDGVCEVDEPGSEAHVSLHMNSNGMKTAIDGYYLSGKLYNSYNNVTYYEDMSLSDVKKTMIVPLEPYFFSADQIASVTCSTVNEATEAVVVLKPDAALEIFQSRYDNVDFLEGTEASVNDCKITDVFDADGKLVSENTEFDLKVSYSSQDFSLKFTSELNYTAVDETGINITDDMKKDFDSYVLFSDIDPNSISSDDLADDSAEDTVAATFQKRLVNRLGYTVNEHGQYVSEFNDGEAYVIDFNNSTFLFRNHSIEYTYSWRGDVGSMGGCTYQFGNDSKASGCEDSTVETIQDVKKYLEMELYYCGLSLNELMKEAAGEE